MTRVSGRGGTPFCMRCVYYLKCSGKSGLGHGPFRPFTILKAGPGFDRRAGFDKLVASPTVVQW
jgi:hypothetical protein